MPTYTYECDGCGAEDTQHMTIADHTAYNESIPLHTRDTHVGREHCGYWRQVFAFRIKKSMPEHYSHTLDSVVSSEKDFEQQLHERSRADSERHGYDVKYETFDPSDAVAAGVKDDVGLESQAKAHHDAKADGHRHIFT